MKEIKRIHIAKVPYDVELDAKKMLEEYLKALEAYSHNEEIVAEVEVRITEILEDRGVKKGGVITRADVEALKRQLGEPREFMDDDSELPAEVEETVDGAPRKLFRDTDHAIFGGVLAGIAAFIKVNPAIVRLVFVVLALASLGTAFLVYAVLWIVVPPARTAADKLQMMGRPVTVNAIREINERDAGRRVDENHSGRRPALVITGILSIIAACASAFITIGVTTAVLFGSQHYAIAPGTGSRFLVGAFILAVLSGVLLTVLFILTAYASFAQKMTKRALVSICVVIVTGLVSFGSAIGLVHYAGMQQSYYIEANTRTKSVTLPANTTAVTALIIDTHGVKVKYYPTTGKVSAQLHAVVKSDADLPNVTTTVEGATLHVTAAQKTGDICTTTLLWCNDTQPTLEIHAPELSLITAAKDSMIAYQPGEQPNLAIHVGDNVSVDVLPGTVENVTVTQGVGSVVSLARATVKNLTVSTKASSNTDAGTVRSLIVQDDGSCPAPTGGARVDVWRVTDGMMTVNSKKQAANTTDTGCTQINIEGVQQS
ncbi:MAG TPA: PspC domain-containing protein [Candidatus Saccharimonadales bacterium]